MLRGLHDTKLPMIYAAIGYWGVGLPLGVLLAFHFGFDGAGIWIGLSSRPRGGRRAAARSAGSGASGTGWCRRRPDTTFAIGETLGEGGRLLPVP